MLVNNFKLFFVSLTLIFLPIVLGWGATGITALGSLLLLTSFYLYLKSGKFDALLTELKLIFNQRLFYILLGTISTLWLLVNILNYYALEYKIMDTGSFSNVIFNFIHTGVYFNTFLNMHGFEDHFTPNLLLFSPFFKLYPNFMWLIFAKTFAFLACPILLVNFGKKVLGNKSKLVFIPAMLWLVHEYLANTMFFSFQPSSLSLPFVIIAFYLAFQRKYILMLLPLIFILGFKEHMALTWVSIGCFIFFINSDKKIGGVFTILGILLGLLVFFVLAGLLSGTEGSTHGNQFGPFLHLDRKLKLVVYILASVGFLPLLYPKTLLFFLPSLGLAMVANSATITSFSYHYHDLPLTILFVAVIFSLKSISEKSSWIFQLDSKKRNWVYATILFFTLSSNTQLPQWKLRQMFYDLKLPEWNDGKFTKYNNSEVRLYPEVLEELNVLRRKFSKDKQLWVPNHLGTYLTDYPNIKRIEASPKVIKLKGEEGHLIVFGKLAETSSMSPSKFEKFVAELKDLHSRKRYKKIKGFKHIQVFEKVI